MVTHIQLHRSGVTGATPDVSTLFEGEPAVNLPDKKLYVKGSDGSLITLVEPAPVTSVNGSTGAVTITDLVGVATFNGASGDVQGVSSVSGLTGTISAQAGRTAMDLDEIYLKKSIITGTEESFTTALKNKVDAIEASADVTDSANVTSAGALMDSELSDLAGVKGVTISTLQVKPSEGAFADGDKTKLDAIEASADVTDAINVAAAVASLTLNVAGLSAGGSTFSNDVLIENAGDVSLTIKGDIDNSGENDNPLIRLEQDGAAVSCNIGINGESNNQFVGAQPNSFYIEAESSSGAANQTIQFATNNADVMTLNGDGNVGINTSTPRQKLEVVGTVLTPGISADGATFSGASFGAVTISDLVNNAYALPAADGSAGQVMMTDGADAVSFQTIKFMANFVLDSDVPLATGIRDKAIYYIPYDNCVVTEVHLRSDDASAAGDATSLAVAIETIQRLAASGGLNDANPTGVTLLTVTMDETASEDHVSSEVGLTHAVGTDNNKRAIRINVTDNTGNHTNLQVMIKMEARTT